MTLKFDEYLKTQDNAEIQVSYWVDSEGWKYPIYEWNGDIAGIARVDPFFPVDNLPWPVEVLHQTFEDVFIQRLDTGSYFWNRILKDADLFANEWKKVQIRIIWTLHVWGMAYIPPGSRASWAAVGKRNPNYSHG